MAESGNIERPSARRFTFAARAGFVAGLCLVFLTPSLAQPAANPALGGRPVSAHVTGTRLTAIPLQDVATGKIEFVDASALRGSEISGRSSAYVWVQLPGKVLRGSLGDIFSDQIARQGQITDIPRDVKDVPIYRENGERRGSLSRSEFAPLPIDIKAKGKAGRRSLYLVILKDNQKYWVDGLSTVVKLDASGRLSGRSGDAAGSGSAGFGSGDTLEFEPMETLDPISLDDATSETEPATDEGT